METINTLDSRLEITQTIKGSYIEGDNEITFLVKVPVEEARYQVQNQSLKVNKVVMIALDRSGSMSGSPFRLAIEAIVELVKLIHSGVEKIVIYVYCTSCSKLEYKKGDDIKVFETEITNLSIGWGTSFNCVFTEIQNQINELKNSGENTFVSCLFFTDGEDYVAHNDALQEVPGSVYSQLKDCLTLDSSVKTDVHCLGFSASHDALLLGKISEMGYTKGTFQYIASAPDIPAAVDNLTEILSIVQLPFVVQLEDGRTIALNVDYNDEAVFVAEKHLVNFTNLRLAVNLKQSTTDENNVRLVTEVIKEVGLIELSPLNLEDTEDSTGYNMLVTLNEIKVKSLASKVFQGTVNQLNVDEINTIAAELEALDKKLLDIIPKATKLKPILRKKLIKKVQQVRLLVNELRRNLVELRNGSLSNEKIAKWQSLASKNALLLGSKGQRTLDKRSATNATAIESMEAKIEAIVLQTDFDKLQQETDPKLIQDIMCYMTRCNFIEAMEEGDCIGIGLQVRRSEATVFDPTQLQILNVGPTFVTCEAFMDLLSYKLAENNDSEALHGGFDNTASSSVATGVGSESINAVLPLFINKEHWSIASKRSMSILAWICTLSLTGGSGLEIKTVPFLVLAKCIADFSAKPTQHNLTMLQLVFETCLAVYNIPFAKSLREETIEQYRNYLKGPEGRTVDCINNHSVFLAKLLCALHTGDLSKEEIEANLTTLKDGLIEEVVRRHLNAPYVKFDNSEDLFLLFELDSEKVLGEATSGLENSGEEKASATQLDYGTMFQDLVAGRVVEEVSTAADDVVELNFKLDSDMSRPLPTPTQQFVQQVKDVVQFKVEKHLVELEFLATSTQGILEGTLKTESAPQTQDIFLDWCTTKSPWWLVAFFLQSYQHRKNPVRRQALAKATYKDFLTAEGSTESFVHQYLNTEIGFLIQGKVDTVSKIQMGRRRRERNSKIAEVFHNTSDLNLAAGILRFQCKFTSVRLFKAIVTAMTQPSHLSPTIQLEKTKMLVYGTYNEIPLYQNFVADKLCQWKPTVKTQFELLLALQGRTDISQDILHPVDLDALDQVVPGSKVYLKRRQKFEESQLKRDRKN